ncbi:hypothetical protein [Streptomyces sp. NBC_01092]|uniref:hypothetical protein n=1 Tax=Streptomyces sp. NBC_01092 TaxID=2903748 RepID=UPI00386D58B9|nr:hypothetical protein OG254_12510 [Streptomyces sp. NBC_01092]
MISHVEETVSAQPAVGVGRTVAYALAVLGTDAVQRRTLRALLPKGELKQRGLTARTRQLRGEQIRVTKNKTSKVFGETLQRFEACGWLERTPDLVHVRNRAALLEHALQGRPAVPRELLDLQRALDTVRADDRAAQTALVDELREQRRQEMKALMALMQAPAAGTGPVRIVHKSQVI